MCLQITQRENGVYTRSSGVYWVLTNPTHYTRHEEFFEIRTLITVRASATRGLHIVACLATDVNALEDCQLDLAQETTSPSDPPIPPSTPVETTPTTAESTPTLAETTTTTAESTTTTTTTTSTTTTTPTPQPTWRYDYIDALRKSLLFYEAQRSGRLPSTNRIPWRGDSALNDVGFNGEDLTGGWYDAGDHVKFSFPMASAVTLLAWGIDCFWESYVRAGALEDALDSIKWPLDYFIKSHIRANKLYVQVGDPSIDQMTFGPPETVPMPRPAFQISAPDNKNGSEVAAEVAAAMTASSIVFRRSGNHAYAEELLSRARELYDFAYEYRGTYTDAIPEQARAYRSWNGYEDELAWGALWLYKATNNRDYVRKAVEFFPPWEHYLTPYFSWDSKYPGAFMLFYTLNTPRRNQALSGLEAFFRYWSLGQNEVQITPLGLSFLLPWGSLRYSANAAFLATVAAKNGISPSSNVQFAQRQMHYILGDTGHSFVCGFGHNPPQRPHHQGSSCPVNAPCGWPDYQADRPNPNVLYGAMVGGPNATDHWVDDRADYIGNEVAVDYNAGFQSTIAALIALT